MICFISYTFVGNVRVKLAKNQANDKQYPDFKISLFKDYSHSSSTLSSKNNIKYFKK